MSEKSRTDGFPVIAKVHAYGKVTIPHEIRKLMGISDGDFVEIVVKRKVEKV